MPLAAAQHGQLHRAANGRLIMDLRSLFAFLLDPKILATAGGYASYKYLAKDKAGLTRYAYGAGGALAGYLVGRVAQHYLAASQPPRGVLDQPLPAGAGGALTPEQRALLLDRQYVDFDSPQPLALPAPAPAAPAPDVRAAGVSDAELLNSFGSYNPGSVDDSGDESDGTNGVGGAYESGYGADAAEEQVRGELRAKRAARSRHGRN